MKTETVKLTVESLTESGIPEAFWHFQADTYVGSPEAFEACRKYAAQFQTARKKNLGLFIRGPQEAQKTFLATYVLRYLIVEAYAVLYLSLPDLVDRLFQKDFNIKEFLEKPDCLVLDNLNVPGSSMWPVALSRALLVRKDAGKPTICLTQLMKQGSRDDFGVQYGEASLRLIEHVSHTVWAEIDEAKKHQAERERKGMFVDEV